MPLVGLLKITGVRLLQKKTGQLKGTGIDLIDRQLNNVHHVILREKNEYCKTGEGNLFMTQQPTKLFKR